MTQNRFARGLPHDGPRTSADHSVAAMSHGLFIDEQASGDHWREMVRGIRREFEWQMVWSPVSCRHTSWTYASQPYGRAPP